MRGVSPIIAALLLALIAAGVAVILYLEVSGAVNVPRPALLRTSFIVESARVFPLPGTDIAVVRLVLRNVGGVSLSLNELRRSGGLNVYIYDHYDGRLVYEADGVLSYARVVPSTSLYNGGVVVYDANMDGVWEPRETLVVEFVALLPAPGAVTPYTVYPFYPAAPATPAAQPFAGSILVATGTLGVVPYTSYTGGLLARDASGNWVVLYCGHMYDIVVTMGGVSARYNSVPVDCGGAA